MLSFIEQFNFKTDLISGQFIGLLLFIRIILARSLIHCLIFNSKKPLDISSAFSTYLYT